jgi:hypothetical protein
MKSFLACLLLSGLSPASETALTIVHQPLEGFGSGGIHIVKVPCKDHYASSGLSGASLITTANLAPANGPEGSSDINLASVAGIKMNYFEHDPKRPGFNIDCTAMAGEPNGRRSADVLRATLECLRLTEPSVIKIAELKFQIPEKLTECRKVADEFLTHDKSKPFFKSGE